MDPDFDENDPHIEIDIVKMSSYIYLTLIVIATLIIHSSEGELSLDYFVGKIPIIEQCIIGGVVAAVFILLSIIGRRYFQWVQQLEVIIKEITGDLQGQDIIMIALFSGIAEELLFRAALQPHLGIVITSFLFGLMHYAPGVPVLWIYPYIATAMGFYFWLFSYDHRGRNNRSHHCSCSY